MDDSKFLSVFGRLQSRDKVVLREAVQQLVDFLARAQAANSTEERNYALTRLTKGLASALHEVKVGFSLALTALLRHFPAIDPISLYRSYTSFDQSISSTHCLKLGQITLIACILRSRPEVRRKELEKDLVELFRQRKEMGESISEVILQSSNAESIVKGLEDAGNVNYLRLTYALQSPGSEVVSHAVKAKAAILEGSLAALPRLHSVWTPILDSAYASDKYSSLRLPVIWKQFIESGIQAADKHKKKLKFLSLGLSLFAQILTRSPLLLSVTLTPLFLKNWQEQCTHKNSRLHDQANTLKFALYNVLNTAATEDDCVDLAVSVAHMAKTVHGSEMMIRLTEFLAGKMRVETAVEFCREIMNSGNEQVIACLLNKLCKREESELRRFSMQRLLEQVVNSPANTALKAKLVDALAVQQLEEVSAALELYLQHKTQVPVEFRKTGKRLLKRIQPFQLPTQTETIEPPKKRKRSQNGVFTNTQLQALCKLAILKLISATHSEECPDSDIDALMSVTEALKDGFGRTSELNLFDCILKSASDSLLRDPTKTVFREFIDELPDSYAQKLGKILISTPNSAPNRPDSSDVLGDDIELEENEDINEVLSTNTANLKGKYSENDVLRASDLAEVIIKRSKIQSQLVIIGKSLALGLRKATENVKNRFKALLGKLAKGNIEVTESSFEGYLGFLSLILSLNRKEGSLYSSTRALSLTLCKKLADFNPIDTSDLVTQSVKIALERHACKSAFEQLKQLLSQVPKCCTNEVFAVLLEGVVSSATHFIHVQSMELLKVAAKRQPAPVSVLKALVKYTRKVVKGELETKQAHNDLKVLLGTVLTACKKAEFTHRRLQRICEKAAEKCKKVMGVLSVVGELQKHIHEMESKV